MASQVIQRQQELIDELSFFDDWEDKYDYIISLGKQLPNFTESKKTNSNLVKGCQSQVWFDSSIYNGKLNFIATSDALIVSGLIAVLLRIYNDATPSDILNSNVDFVRQIGFGNNLSSNRTNGLKSMLNYIYATATKNQ
ncbi:Fe-S metabolism protein SufE [Francisella halioticida]|uniref:Fe-S cluster assembly protein SufE n=1 Tax=Francisella halioticida TaxID=549298 RepID=A0ABN5B0F9_9GAMM|nr:SufE family protein [Francisella halioticida]ASG68082.1 Fe-S cluster assembly protein SufE [Francisella halioticida]BCD90351.1 Fe-S metabolism protein SufE [Francisella halioticida]